LIEEVIDGVEFTIQCITDGVQIVFPAATYDYPYRFSGDVGPGTGGMGAYSLASKTLPFLTNDLYFEACNIVKKFLGRLQPIKNFNGVLNPGFFVTNKKTLKIIEFNSRFGDPECMNIMSLLDSKLLPALVAIESQHLKKEMFSFKETDSLVMCLVSPDYGVRQGRTYRFHLDTNGFIENGIDVHFSSSIKVGPGEYQTIGSSRCVALAASGDVLEILRERMFSCLDRFYSGPLEWRCDIGSSEDIARAFKKLGL
jgi:phosphoribosylamine-glycine ligase